MKWGRRGSLVVYGLIAVLAILSLVVLFRLRDRFEATLTDRINDLQRVFSNRELLKAPNDARISFNEIEAEAAKFENRGEFGEIRIAKLIDGEEHVVYPFYVPALTAAGIPLPEERTVEDNTGGGSFWQRLSDAQVVVSRPLVSDGERLGSIEIEVNEAPFRTVSLVIWALGTMLATSLAFLATQFRRQEKVISATTIELEEKRRELVRLERLALAGQLSANILHDLKKPVLNIRNEADEAISPPGDAVQPEQPVSIFGRIREQADFFLSMLKEAGFDRFVRAGEDREYVDVNDLLNRSIALVRYEQASVKLDLDLAPDLPPILADPVRLIQVFSNLVLNAYQALGGRGVVEVKTFLAGDAAVVEISDNGPGIPEDLQEHIFEPFFTTKPAGQGTGLGLYIVRDIMRDFGGDIVLESRPGQTLFRMTFPLTT